MRSANKSAPQTRIPSQVQPLTTPLMPDAPVTKKSKETSKSVTTATQWALKSDLNFQLKPIENKDLEPWYTTNTGNVFSDGLYVDGRYYDKRYLSLHACSPHTVKWELKIQPGSKSAWHGGGERGWQFTEDGFYIVARDSRVPGTVTPNQVYDLSIEREGDQLRYLVDDKPGITLTISDTDRTPLMAASEHYDFRILQARLFFKVGEDFSDAPPSPVAALKEPRWEVAYQDNFNDPECINRYFKMKGGELVWHEKYKALWLKNDPGKDIYTAVHKSLPGDLRIRFRALRNKFANQVNIGVLFCVNGALLHEQGYFAELAHGHAQIKKRNHIQKRVSAPTPPTPDRWVNIELRRVGPQITICIEGKTVLEWTDPHPFRSSANDLFAFYTWHEQTIVDDLMIERNADDPVKPLADDPLARGNMRTGPALPTDNDF
ncbi:MAG: hypothetical protein V1899_06805 [Planctomycetota bacterium]